MLRSSPPGRLRRAPWSVIIAAAVVAVVLASCARFMPDPNPPTKPGAVSGAGPVVEITASADGPLAAACPTLAEAQAAVPATQRGPDINTTVFKTMVLQCNYTLPGLDGQLHPNGIGILVFDASAEGKTMWDSVRTDPTATNPTEISSLADVADVAFYTGTPGHNDVWVVKGKYAFHLSFLAQSGVPLKQLAALARAMLAGLARAG